MQAKPLTLGTAGHVDHGKTSLVAALTGVDTDRLPEEKARGLTIALGYAPLRLPSGRQLSLVDVPGHERFVRTMVAGASGLDLFLMAVAADDGVMPQTLEHADVLRALNITAGVVAITKADVADPRRAVGEAVELLPGCPIVTCSTRTGDGLGELRVELDAIAARVTSRAMNPGGSRLHIDRVLTIPGRGTVVTGTLWSGAIGRGDELELAPSRRRVRVRGVEVHNVSVKCAHAGQRVAVNLIGVRQREVARGDVLAAVGMVQETTVVDCVLQLRDARLAERVQVHHGTRAVAGHMGPLEDDTWRLRLERPLLALAGDRLVVRRLAPPRTLGGGIVVDAEAHRRRRRADTPVRQQRLRAGERLDADGYMSAPVPEQASTDEGRVIDAVPRPEGVREQEVERLLREAGSHLLSEMQLLEQADALRELRAQGRAVRVSGRLYGHAEVVAHLREQILSLIEREESVTLAGVRDALGLSRKSSQALLEHLDAMRLTRRLPDDRRVLARRRAGRLEPPR
jgi:selenocysteine-specific elongation factor